MMADSKHFEQTPLFQLNLLLWLVWSSSPDSITGIKPFFREQGYLLQAIGQPLSLSLAVQSRANHAGIPIQTSSKPDLLLRHSNRQLLLPIECKIRSFGPDSGDVRQ